MRLRLGFMSALLSATVILAGCRLGYRSFDDDHDRHYRPRHVSRARRIAHVCTRDCNHHYWNGTELIELPVGHHHGPHCGHVWNGVHWVVVRHEGYNDHRRRGPRRVRRHDHGHEYKHVHSATCGHVYNRKKHKWVKTKKGHIHRKGCGHRFVNGRWVKRR